MFLTAVAHPWKTTWRPTDGNNSNDNGLNNGTFNGDGSNNLIDVNNGCLFGKIGMYPFVGGKIGCTLLLN
jgi:hypothetical protein